MSKRNEVFDDVLNMVIDEAVNIVNEADGCKLVGEVNIEFSEKHENKMKKLFKNARKDILKQRCMVYGKKVACVLLAMMFFAGASICSVEAWRERFLNFFFDENAPNSDYNFSDLGGTYYSDDYISLSYVPWGFEVAKNALTSRGATVYFIKSDLFFEVNVKALDVKSNLDTENAIVENIKINDYDAIYIAKEDINQIIWHNEKYSFYVSGNLSKNEIVKIAKYLKKI